MTNLTSLVTYTPPRTALADPAHSVAVQQFKRGANALLRLLSEQQVIEPKHVNARDLVTIRSLMSFVQWVRSTGSPEQWSTGIALASEDIYAAIGRDARDPLTFTLRSCLKKIKNGNRKKGEKDTYTLSKPHYLGVVAAISANAAWQAAEAAIEIEEKARKDAMAESLFGAPATDTDVGVDALTLALAPSKL